MTTCTRDPSIWECIPVYCGSPVFGNAFQCIGVPQFIGVHSHIIGYPSIWECNSHILGYPSLWKSIPTYLEHPIYGRVFPHMGVPKYIGMHSHILGHIWESPGIWVCVDASPYIRKYLPESIGITRSVRGIALCRTRWVAHASSSLRSRPLLACPLANLCATVRIFELPRSRRSSNRHCASNRHCVDKACFAGEALLHSRSISPTCWGIVGEASPYSNTNTSEQPIT
jgi:hypothetical protein